MVKRMTKQKLALLLASVVTGATVTSAFAANTTNTASSFSAAQQEEIGRIAMEYLVNNPEVLIDASMELKAREDAKQNALRVSEAVKQKNALLNDKETPFEGNADGDVAIVKFLDYQCSYCIKSSPIVDAILAKNSDAKLLIKNFPILAKRSKLSDTAARVSLEVFKQQGEKGFAIYHQGIMQLGLDGEKLTDVNIQALVKKTGATVDLAQLEEWSPELMKTMKLAQELRFSGTPAYVVMPVKGANEQNTTVLGGYVEEATLQAAVALAKQQG